MVTSRSVPHQTAQIFSPFAGQNRAALRFSQIGQDTESPMVPCGRSAEYAATAKITKMPATGKGSRQDSAGGASGLETTCHLSTFAFLDGLAQEVLNLAV